MSTLLTADERSFPNPKSGASLMAYKAFADAAAKGSLFLLTIVAARRLTPYAFGVFSLGSTAGWIAAVAADFGIQMHVARAVAQQPAHASRLLRTWLRVRCWTAVAALAVVAIGLVLAGSPLETASSILVLTFVYAVSGLIELLHYVYRGLARADIESSIVIWQRLATLASGLIALAWRPTVGALATAMAISVVATFAASLRLAFGLTSRGDAPFSVEAPMVRTDFLQEVAPIGVGVLLSALYFRLDVLLVGLWAGTEAVAQYNAVFRLVEALRLFPAAVLAVALPELCRARDWRPLLRVMRTVTMCGLVATLPLWVAATATVPLVYGSQYAAAVPAFRVLMLSFPLMCANYALTTQLIGWGGQRLFAAICGVALAANVALNAQLIPAWSIVGAAWSTLVTELVVTAGCAVALYRVSIQCRVVHLQADHTVGPAPAGHYRSPELETALAGTSRNTPADSTAEGPIEHGVVTT